MNTPEEHMGDVIGDLNSRRGLIGEFIDKPGGIKLIKVCVLPTLPAMRLKLPPTASSVCESLTST